MRILRIKVCEEVMTKTEWKRLYTTILTAFRKIKKRGCTTNIGCHHKKEYEVKLKKIIRWANN